MQPDLAIDRALLARLPAEPDPGRELVVRLAEGDAGAAEGLYDLYADDMYALALWVAGCSFDAADAVQEVFARLLAMGHRAARIRKPRAYLLRAARTAAIDLARRRGREPGLPEEALLVGRPGDQESRAEAARVSRLLAELPEPQRVAVYLRLYAGLTFAEIGDVTGVSLFTAASRYRLGLRRLRRALEAA